MSGFKFVAYGRCGLGRQGVLFCLIVGRCEQGPVVYGLFTRGLLDFYVAFVAYSCLRGLVGLFANMLGFGALHKLVLPGRVRLFCLRHLVRDLLLHRLDILNLGKVDHETFFRRRRVKVSQAVAKQRDRQPCVKADGKQNAAQLAALVVLFP